MTALVRSAGHSQSTISAEQDWEFLVPDTFSESIKNGIVLQRIWTGAKLIDLQTNSDLHSEWK